MVAGLAANAALAALLGVVLAGLGAATLLSAPHVTACERQEGARLLDDRRTRTVYAPRQ